MSDDGPSLPSIHSVSRRQGVLSRPPLPHRLCRFCRADRRGGRKNISLVLTPRQHGTLCRCQNLVSKLHEAQSMTFVTSVNQVSAS